jgi:hypothetical protein
MHTAPEETLPAQIVYVETGACLDRNPIALSTRADATHPATDDALTELVEIGRFGALADAEQRAWWLIGRRSSRNSRR